MRSQAQYTIYSLNDVYTAATAPTNPYNGQLWVDTSSNPPITKVYDGSAWKEQNGTDTIKSNVQTLTTKQATFETNLNGLSSTVATHTTQITNIGDVVDNNCDDIADLQSDVSGLQQTATEISATVSHKVDETLGDASSSFGWSLTSTGFHIYSNATEVVKITSSGLEVSGKITSTTGQIGGFTINSSNLHTGSKTSYSSSTSGVYIGTNGIGLGTGNFYVTSSGSLYTKNGTIGCFTLNSSYLYAGTSNTDNYVLLGQLSSSRTVCGTSLSNWGLILGTKFGVSRAGVLYGSDAHITGDITATSGSFSDCTIDSSCDIYGYVYMSGSEEVKFYGAKTTMSYETWIGGTGIASTITQNQNGTIFTSYSYNRPFGQIIVPGSYSTNANDGMIFGIMEGANFKIQNLLCGVSFTYNNINSYTTYGSEAIFRAGDKTFLDAVWDNTLNTHECTVGFGGCRNFLNGDWYFGEGNTGSYLGVYYTSAGNNIYYYGGLYGSWYCLGSLYFRSTSVTSSNGYISNTTQNSSNYAYLGGTWYANEMYFGSYSGYRVRLDGDQVTFYYSGTYVGELEAYSSYVDVQGTWKTNGNNWISSSDRRIKKDILDFDESYDVLFNNLKPRQYRYVNGNKGRIHSGFIAQEVSDAVTIAGKTIDEIAYVCAFENKEGDVYYGLRYEELIALNTWQIQKLKERIRQLEERLL